MPTSTTPASPHVPDLSTSEHSQRLLSLDFMRGFIMVLLTLESTRMYGYLNDYATGGPFSWLTNQLEHHPWNGLHFWDLIQPGFMFMAGTAMALSLDKQWKKGVAWSQSFRKALKRSGWLFFWGVLDYAVRPKGLSFELWDVLTQLSFTLLVAFLIFRWSIKAQLAVSVGLLLLTEVLYRCIHVPGFDQPFVDQHNFGNYMDTVLMNKVNKGGWVAINCIPTAAHTIWGAVVGKLLLSSKPGAAKVKTMVVAGLICLAAGFLLDIAHITPIIKKIATSSFTLASGGYCLIALAFCYWWIDLRNHRKYLLFFTVLGMNSIFIYLFFEIVGDRWFTEYITTIASDLLQIVNAPVFLQLIVSALCVFWLEWGLCYWLYKKKIFFKL